MSNMPSGSIETTGEGEEETVNKKRQDLSDQLKQISIKIDKEIGELRKQNNTGIGTSPVSLAMLKKNDLLGYSSRAMKTKAQEPSANFISANGVINMDKESISLPR